jgi:acyl-CoA thioesterase I
MPPSDATSPRRPLRRGTLAALSLVGFAAACSIVLTPAGHRASASGDRCVVAEDDAALARPLPHVAARLAGGGGLTIVALGSSSTAGTGATRPDRTYPSRLAALLQRRFPERSIRVLNRGVPGEQAPAMAARIARDVIPAQPDLVIWQVGTNGLLHDGDASSMGEVVRAGIARIKAAGADVMIMNPQYAPAVLQHPHYRDVLHALDAAAFVEDVPLLPRFAIMRQWAEEGRMPLKAMLAADRLHMSDASYDCLARQISASIAELVTPPSSAPTDG